MNKLGIIQNARIYIVAAVAIVAAFAFAAPAFAATDWETTNNYIVAFNLTGDPTLYSHDMFLTQDSSDNLSGNGGYPAGGPFSYAWTIDSGTVVGNTINISMHYTLGAVCTMTMTGTIAPSGTMSGTWADNCGGPRTGDWTTTSGLASLTGGVAPIVSAVAVLPAPPVAGAVTTLTANVDDTTTGNSNITSAEYRITGGAWTPMTATDASFNSPNENVTADITFATPGIKEVCVRGTDAGGNTSTPSGDDCVIVNVIDPTVGYVSGGGNIKDGKGKPTFTFGGNAGTVPGVGLVGQLQVVNHTTKVSCHYNVINSLLVVGNTATVNATGKCNDGSTPTSVLTYVDNGTPGTTDKFNTFTLAGGNIKVGTKSVSSVSSYAATDSAYYNGLNVSDGLYGTGPITFTWDGAGNVTGGLWEEIVPATVGTHYFNIVTGGTVVGGVVNLTLERTNPGAYGPFSLTGNLVGGVLTGTAAGPYLFTSTGVVTP